MKSDSSRPTAELKPGNEPRFWMVVKTDGSAPQGWPKHPTKELAELEAKRIASSSRQRYYVMECVSCFEPMNQVQEVKIRD